MPTPIKKKLSLKEFKKYVADKDFGVVPPTFIVLHHTFRPTPDTWNGKTTVDALDKNYRALGWGGRGPHLFIAPDGIWLFTDMYEVGIHAGTGNGSLATGYSIGIEVVGNYDGAVWTGVIKEQTLGVIHTLLERLNIPKSKIMFHSDFSKKSCPGLAINKPWVKDQLKKYEDSLKAPKKEEKPEIKQVPKEEPKAPQKPVLEVTATIEIPKDKLDLYTEKEVPVFTTKPLNNNFNTMQEKNSFDAVTMKKIGTGALIATSGALLTYVSEELTNVNYGAYTAIVVAVLSILVNMGREFLKGK